MNTAVVTIISKNYLPYARTMLQSVGAVHPEWQQYVLVVDEIRGDFDPAKEAFRVVEVAQLPLPERRKFYFRYSLVELNTATKPWVLEWMFDHEGFDRVIYIDPDIYVYDRLTDVESKLEAGALMVLTPHLTGMLDDDGFPSEIDILRTGTFNLGFLALNRHPSLGRFLKWWQRKLEFTCVGAPDRGYFVDQRWMDFAPCLFDDVVVLRHDGYNVAHWNLYQRDVTVRDGRYLVNGRPLIFWHFSSFSTRDPEGPEWLSKNHNRVNLTNREPVKTIARDYAGRLAANGQADCSGMAYEFGSFANGERIPYWIREAYRDDEAFQKAAGDDPFSTAIDYLNQSCRVSGPDDGIITNAMQFFWRARKDDLQISFPNYLRDREDRNRFVEWLVWYGTRNAEFPTACITPLRSYVPHHRKPDGVHAAKSKPAQIRGRYALGPLLGGDPAGFIVNAYDVILMRYPDPIGFTNFMAALQGGTSRIEILHALRYSAEGRQAAIRIRGLLPSYIWARIRRQANQVKKLIGRSWA